MTAKGSSAPVTTVSRHLPTATKTGTFDAICIPTLDIAVQGVRYTPSIRASYNEVQRDSRVGGAAARQK